MTRSFNYTRVRELFEAACDLPRGERSAFLAQACGDDEALRDEVRSLLEYDTDGDDALSDFAIDRGEGLGFVATEEPGSLPERFGSYRIIRLIGSGGMGEVYEAEQRSPRRRVALKIMHAGVASEQIKRRFRMESEIQGLLRHPGIAQVYETGVDIAFGRQVPYFAMELVEGLPLTVYADRHGLDTDARLRLMIDICDAVESAHAQGVIHRDLKPENILVEESTNGPRIKVLDFGVAKLTESDVQFTTVRTEIGQIIGTLSYMSPEQVAGRTDALDARTDVHALGAILYELLTGSRPFDLAGRPLPEAARIICDDDPTLISRIDRSLRGDLEIIVARALEKDPARRYQSSRALGDDLRRVLENQPVVARPPSAMYQLSKFAKRNKGLVGGIAATVVALSLGLVVATWFAFDAAAGRRLARWQSYRTSIAAAMGAFDQNQPLSAQRLLDEAPAEYRGWEHAYLTNRFQSWERTFGDGDLRFVAVDRDACQVIGVRPDGTMTVWDAGAGAVVARSDVGEPIADTSTAVHEGWMSVLTEAGAVIRYDVLRGRRGITYAAAPGGWEAVDQSVDGTRVIAMTRSEVFVWEADDGALVVRQTPDPGFPQRVIRDVSIGPRGRWVGVAWSGGQSRWSQVLDLDTGETYPTTSGERPIGTAFSPDGRYAAVRMQVRNVHIHDLVSRRPVAVLEGHAGSVSDAVFLGDGRLASVSQGLVRVRPINPDAIGTCLLLPNADEGPTKLLTLGGTSLLTFESRTGRAVLWEPDRRDADVLKHNGYVYNLAWSPGGRLLVTQEFKADVTRVWDADHATIVAEIPGPTALHAPLCFSSDGAILVLTDREAGSRTQRLGAIETSGWSRLGRDLDDDSLAELLGGTVGLRLSPEAAYSPDGRSLLRREKSDEGRTWELIRDGKRITDEAGIEGGNEAAWHPSGHWFAITAESPPRIVVCDGRTGTPRREIEQSSTVYSVDISPDGSRLAAGCEDGVVRLYDTRLFQLVAELNGHASYVHVVRFSPDGTRLASGSGDGTVRLWDTVPRAVRRANPSPDSGQSH